MSNIEDLKYQVMTAKELVENLKVRLRNHKKQLTDAKLALARAEYADAIGRIHTKDTGESGVFSDDFQLDYVIRPRMVMIKKNGELGKKTKTIYDYDRWTNTGERYSEPA